jgi:rubrerythrin
MPNIFHIVEVVEIGIEKEKKRRDFYSKVAENFADQEMHKLFTMLRDWEEVHIKRFTEIKESIVEPGSTESFPGEAFEYMRSLVGDRFYDEVKPASFSSKVTDSLAAIDYAMMFEKDAILFFGELARFTPDYSRGIISELVEEERKHLLFLSKLREKYSN